MCITTKISHSIKRFSQVMLILITGLTCQAMANPALLEDIATTPTPQDSNPQSFAEMGGFLYFSASTLQSGQELWATDGTTTWQVADIRTGSGSSSPDFLTVYNNALSV